MSFASDVKEEIGKQYDKGRHCQIAQLAVIFALTGHIKRDFKNENRELDSCKEILYVIKVYV